MARQVLVPLTGLVLACAGDEAPRLGETRAEIVNGELTFDYPATGGMLSGDALTWLGCSGTLIGCRTFLTAAHCVGDGDPAANAVYLQHGGVHAIEAITMHPDYGPEDGYYGDVAVVTLAEPVSGIVPARLVGARPAAGRTATIVGFGRTGGTRADHGLKRFAQVRLESCNDLGQQSHHLCWRYETTGSTSCNGDSGGSTYVEDEEGLVLAGVTSFHVAPATQSPGDACQSDTITVNQSVAAYLDFIRDAAIEPLGAPECPAMPGDVRTVAEPLAPETPEVSAEVDVPPGTALLRIAMNARAVTGAIGEPQTLNEIDLVATPAGAGASETPECADHSPGSVGSCTVSSPAPGPWRIAALLAGGAGGRVQLTTTLFGGAPIPEADAWIAVAEGTLEVAAAEGVLANDRSGSEAPLVAELIAEPAHGTLALDPSGSFTYAPDPGFSGEDLFRYRATDGTYHGEAQATISVEPGPEPEPDPTEMGEVLIGGCTSASHAAPRGALALLILCLTLVLLLAVGVRWRHAARMPPRPDRRVRR